MDVLTRAAAAQDAALAQADKIADNLLQSSGATAYLLFWVLVLVLAALVVAVALLYAKLKAAPEIAEARCAAELAGKDAEIKQLKYDALLAVANAKTEAANGLVALIKTYEKSMERVNVGHDRLVAIGEGHRNDFQRIYDLGKKRDDDSAATSVSLATALTKLGSTMEHMPNLFELKALQIVYRTASSNKPEKVT